ncbi:hypothetical protein Q1695_011920 [Nippostrongylus brasiliensis]|nr:hypothetical protein Q1695_011920 [Nippostrongylus brasiliensis]
MKPGGAARRRRLRRPRLNGTSSSWWVVKSASAKTDQRISTLYTTPQYTVADRNVTLAGRTWPSARKPAVRWHRWTIFVTAHFTHYRCTLPEQLALLRENLFSFPLTQQRNVEDNS